MLFWLRSFDQPEQSFDLLHACGQLSSGSIHVFRQCRLAVRPLES